MTDREAIDALQYMISGDCTDTQMDYTDEIEFAISALRERIEREGVTDINVGGKWISVESELPDEHDSMFTRFYGTQQWRNTMFKKLSNEVIVAGVFEDGSKFVTAGKTHDGKWDNPMRTIPRTITHWQPLPEPPATEEEA